MEQWRIDEERKTNSTCGTNLKIGQYESASEFRHRAEREAEFWASIPDRGFSFTGLLYALIGLVVFVASLPSLIYAPILVLALWGAVFAGYCYIGTVQRKLIRWALTALVALMFLVAIGLLQSHVYGPNGPVEAKKKQKQAQKLEGRNGHKRKKTEQ